VPGSRPVLFALVGAALAACTDVTPVTAPTDPVGSLPIGTVDSGIETGTTGDSGTAGCRLADTPVEVARIDEPDQAPFRPAFAQDPTDGTVWVGYSRNRAGFTEAEVVTARLDPSTGQLLEEDVFDAGPLTRTEGLAFDEAGRLWVSAGADGRTLLRHRSSSGTWRTIDFAAREPTEPLHALPRHLIVHDGAVWVMGDTCQGPGTTGDDLRAHLILWRYDPELDVLDRVQQPLVMLGQLDDGTPIPPGQQGVVKCTRTFPSRLVPRAGGRVWIVGGAGTWDDVSNPDDDALIRYEGFVYEGDMTGLDKIVAHRPAGFRSDAAFVDVAFLGDEVYFGHYTRPAPEAPVDFELLGAPVATPSALRTLDVVALDPEREARPDSLVAHPSGEVLVSGIVSDEDGYRGIVRRGTAAGFTTTFRDDPSPGYQSFATDLFVDASHHVWSSHMVFDGTADGDFYAVLRRLPCIPGTDP